VHPPVSLEPILGNLHLLKIAHPIAVLAVLGACGGDDQASSVPNGTPNSGSVTLSWEAPTNNTDGSTLTNLAGFRVHYGTAPDTYTESVQLPDEEMTSVVIEDLPPARWYFSVTAYNSVGLESDFSSSVDTLIE